jgi:hypothetical protein
MNRKENFKMKKYQILSMMAAAGLLAGCSSMGSHPNAATAMTLEQLPPAAQTTVRNEVGEQHIYGIQQCSKDGQNCYKVEVERSRYALAKPTLYVAQDGSIIKESHSLADRRNQINEPAGAQNNPSWDPNSSANSANGVNATPGSVQAPSEANPAGSNPNQALPSEGPSGQ